VPGRAEHTVEGLSILLQRTVVYVISPEAVKSERSRGRSTRRSRSPSG
jgi:hypothetical protein